MKNKIGFRISLSLILITLFFISSATGNAGESTSTPDAPVKGMVTMIDLGSKTCIPCKMMTPILEKLETAYKGKAAIVFIDVRENNEQARRYGIRAIPTQIFFDKNGKEVYRHTGFLGEEDIVTQLKKMGVEL